ncbi:MAG: hypothetical protein JNL39_18985 [Opitutaceae bacterium]|nr:hypothetical protein [Opitutaceae bacterium]
MISPTQSPFRPDRPDLDASRQRVPHRATPSQPNGITGDSVTFLRTQLAEQPEVRPEVVERARALAADPDYPSIEIVQRIAEQILGAPDLSEVE